MQNSSQLVYRKTAQGLAEIKYRSGGISARSRSTLIMVNGVGSLEALQKKMGVDVLPILQELELHGYVEAPGVHRPGTVFRLQRSRSLLSCSKYLMPHTLNAFHTRHDNA